MSEFQPHTIDLQFQGTPRVIACYLWDSGDGLALVDTGPSSTLEALESALHDFGAGWGDIRHILLTHIHLDRAGAAAQVLQHSPRARVYVHERGARHLVRPERLQASAAQIYGDRMDSLWGEMRPIDPDLITALAGGETLRLGRAEVRALYTPGHAAHHLVYAAGDELYAGDAGGSRFGLAQAPRPAAPLPDINLAAWEGSISALQALDARWHALRQHLHAEAEWVLAHLGQVSDPLALQGPFTEWVLSGIQQEASDLTEHYRRAAPPVLSTSKSICRLTERSEYRRKYVELGMKTFQRFSGKSKC